MRLIHSSVYEWYLLLLNCIKFSLDTHPPSLSRHHNCNHHYTTIQQEFQYPFIFTSAPVVTMNALPVTLSFISYIRTANEHHLGCCHLACSGLFVKCWLRLYKFPSSVVMVMVDNNNDHRVITNADPRNERYSNKHNLYIIVYELYLMNAVLI